MYINRSHKYVNQKERREIMHLAILMTNTDESEFAQRHPKDGKKFTDLIQSVRPDWRCTSFAVKDGVFPDDIGEFDGAMITGSPASVRSGAAWVDQLLRLIVQMNAHRFPVFGACFGHQAIALALGGAIDHNPDGWAHGRVINTLVQRPDWAAELPQEFALYGSHCECVSVLPDGATAIATSGACNAGFIIGQHVFTTQHHPEMTPDFIAALTDEMETVLGPDIHAQALASLSHTADQAAFAESIARFFEQGAISTHKG